MSLYIADFKMDETNGKSLIRFKAMILSLSTIVSNFDRLFSSTLFDPIHSYVALNCRFSKESDESSICFKAMNLVCRQSSVTLTDFFRRRPVSSRQKAALGLSTNE